MNTHQRLDRLTGIVETLAPAVTKHVALKGTTLKRNSQRTKAEQRRHDRSMARLDAMIERAKESRATTRRLLKSSLIREKRLAAKKAGGG
jgi:hypothetical protein